MRTACPSATWSKEHDQLRSNRTILRAVIVRLPLVPIREALQMAREGKISNGPSALELLRCDPLLFHILN